MLNMLDIKKGIQKLQTNYRYELTEIQFERMTKLWHDKFKYWDLNDFYTTINRIIDESKVMPKIATMWAVYKKLDLGHKPQKAKVGYNCEKCKDSGVRAFKRKGEIHAAYCDCETGITIFRNNSNLPYIGIQISRKDTEEYPIHTSKGPFTGHLPEGVGYKLSKEVCGEKHFMYGLTDKIEKENLTTKEVIKDISEGMKPHDVEELPF